jgi:hypothetical protein
LTAIETILEIEEEFIFQNVSEEVYSQFQKFYILYVLVPLLDLYGNNPKLNKKHAEVVDRLLARVHAISEQKDEQSAIILDWCLKWVSLSLNSEQTEIKNFKIYTFYLNVLRSSQVKVETSKLVELVKSSKCSESELKDSLVSLIHLGADIDSEIEEVNITNQMQ